jgi:hypothetical protein
LIRLGVDHDHAYSFSRTRMGTWAVALSPIMRTTITIERLQKRGYEAMSNYYLKIASFLVVYPDFYRGTAVYETRTYSGVRGSPCQLTLAGQSTRLDKVLLNFRLCKYMYI